MAEAVAAAPHAAGLSLVVSCEHGGRAVPSEHGALFADGAAERALASHRAYDEGAGEVARALAERLGAPLFVGETTRLVVDLNRSRRHPRLFSEWTRGLPPDERARVVERYYLPYRAAVTGAVAAAAAQGTVLHVSAHSFTPVLDGDVRRADVGLLFDPRRPGEAAFATAWRAELRRALPPGLVVRRNYPYRGVADGFTTHLRKRFAADVYLGFELEVNQRHVGRAEWPALVGALAESLDRAVRGYGAACCAAGSSP